MSRIIAVDNKLDRDHAHKLCLMVKVISDAMVNGLWGSIEFKFENGIPLPHYPARESKVLYNRSNIKK